METRTSIAERRSIRAFSPQPVPEDLVLEVLEAASKAPSGGNRQPWSFVVMTGSQKDQLIKQMEDQAEKLARLGLDGAGFRGTLMSLAQAPIVVLVFNTEHQPQATAPAHYEYLRVVDILSIGAAVENMILHAVDLGLGSLWAGFVVAAEEEIRRCLGRPEELVTAVALGFPAESPRPRPRKALDEIVEWRGDQKGIAAERGGSAVRSPVTA